MGDEETEQVHGHLTLMLVLEACVNGLCPQPRWVQRGQSSASRRGTEPTAALPAWLWHRKSALPGWVSGQWPAPHNKSSVLLGKPPSGGCSVSTMMDRATGRSSLTAEQAHPRERTQRPQRLWVTWREGSRTIPMDELLLESPQQPLHP